MKLVLELTAATNDCINVFVTVILSFDLFDTEILLLSFLQKLPGYTSEQLIVVVRVVATFKQHCSHCCGYDFSV